MELSRARANLRVYLSHLNSIFKKHDASKSILRVTRETVELNARIECDAINYLQLIEEAIHRKDINGKKSSAIAVLRMLPTNPFPGIYDEWALELVDQMQFNIEKLAEWVKSEEDSTENARIPVNR